MINLKVAYLRERNYSTEDLAQAPRIESEKLQFWRSEERRVGKECGS